MNTDEEAKETDGLRFSFVFSVCLLNPPSASFLQIENQKSKFENQPSLLSFCSTERIRIKLAPLADQSPESRFRLTQPDRLPASVLGGQHH
jgi:hypothetical protein